MFRSTLFFCTCGTPIKSDLSDMSDMSDMSDKVPHQTLMQNKTAFQYCKPFCLVILEVVSDLLKVCGVGVKTAPALSFPQAPILCDLWGVLLWCNGDTVFGEVWGFDHCGTRLHLNYSAP